VGTDPRCRVTGSGVLLRDLDSVPWLDAWINGCIFSLAQHAYLGPCRILMPYTRTSRRQPISQEQYGANVERLQGGIAEAQAVRPAMKRAGGRGVRASYTGGGVLCCFCRGYETSAEESPD
jgi:hypothetical protein